MRPLKLSGEECTDSEVSFEVHTGRHSGRSTVGVVGTGPRDYIQRRNNEVRTKEYMGKVRLSFCSETPSKSPRAVAVRIQAVRLKAPSPGQKARMMSPATVSDTMNARVPSTVFRLCGQRVDPTLRPTTEAAASAIPRANVDVVRARAEGRASSQSGSAQPCRR